MSQRKGRAINVYGYNAAYIRALPHSGTGRSTYEAVLTKTGAKLWNNGGSGRHDISQAIRDFADRHTTSIDVTFNGRSVTRLYPRAWGH